jgi:hypothetical protein
MAQQIYDFSGEPDLTLKQFATERQWELYEACFKHGSVLSATKHLGMDNSLAYRQLKGMFTRAARRGYAPEFDLTHPTAPGMVSRGTSVRYDGDGQVQQYWNKTKVEGMEPEEAVRLPDPKTITKLSTNYDAEGKVMSQWVAEKPSAVQAVEAWTEFGKALAKEYATPLAAPLPGPTIGDDDLLAVYPVGDHHFGMLAWGPEVDAKWDLNIAEHCYGRAFDFLLHRAPDASQCIIALLGDLFHYDSFTPETPASKNKLDADSRYPKMASVVIRAVRYSIERARAKHAKVHVIPEIGNHDESLMVMLALALSNIYENDPNVTIDISPRLYHYYRFGKNLLGTHHGHRTKMADLPLVMAADRAEDWGETEHRFWMTGHLHSKEVLAKDFTGCRVERFCILAPEDAWAYGGGYRSKREMNSVIFHREFGEVGRNIVSPAMFDQPNGIR